MTRYFTRVSDLHLLLERISSLFRSELRTAASRHDLKLVQLEALVYLSVANRYSDTAGALTEYLGVTKGTVSQTLRVLERRGLVRKSTDPDDGRVVHCSLTPRGKAIVDDGYPVVSFASDDQRSATAAARELLRVLQAGHDYQTFGQCRTCVHLQSEGKRLRCGLTGERLRRAETLKICREHSAPDV